MRPLLTKRDILQVRAFHVIYRMLSDLPSDERFITAICHTSDDNYEKADKALIKEWEISYLRQGLRFMTRIKRLKSCRKT